MVNKVTKKDKINIVIGIISLLILVIGATYAYFAVGTTNNFGTRNALASSGNIGSVAISSNSVNLSMNLTLKDMMDQGSNVTYYASSSGTTTTNTSETLGRIIASSTSESIVYKCNYTVTVSHSGTQDMYTNFRSNSYAGKEKGQAALSINNKNYDWYDGIDNEIEEEVYITSGNTKNITVRLWLENIRRVDQSGLTGKDVTFTVGIKPNTLKCDVVEEPSILLAGEQLNIKMKQFAEPSNASNITARTYANTNVTAIQKYSGVPDSSKLVSGNEIQASGIPVYMWYDNGTLYYYSKSDVIFMNSNSISIFQEFENLNNISGLQYFDTSNVTDMNSLFYNDTSLANISALANWDTSNITDMRWVFYANSSLASLTSLANWDTSNVTLMKSIFYGNSSLTSLTGLENWNTSNVTDMSYMFYGNTSLTSLTGLENWDTSNVTEIESMFWNCSSLTNIGALSNWDTSNVTNMKGTFGGYNVNMSLNDLTPIQNWNVGNVNNMSMTFQSQKIITNLDALSNWDVSNVENFSYIFATCFAITDSSGINDWDVRKGTNFTNFIPPNVHPEFTKVNGTWGSTGTFTKTSNN